MVMRAQVDKLAAQVREVVDARTSGSMGGPMAVGVRCRAVLHTKDWGVKELIEGLRGVDARISGQTAVYKYVRGDGNQPPPTGFISDAAIVLGVSPGWLAFGDGPTPPGVEAWAVERYHFVAPPA